MSELLLMIFWDILDTTKIAEKQFNSFQSQESDDVSSIAPKLIVLTKYTVSTVIMCILKLNLIGK